MTSAPIRNRFASVICTCLFMSSVLSYPMAFASPELALQWNTVEISSDDRGGATVLGSIDEDGALERLSVTIRGHKIAIPSQCLDGLIRPYLNGISISYGQFQSGQSYWSVTMPFDGTGSVELEATFNLVFSETQLLWSYVTIQLDERTWEDRDVCPLHYQPEQKNERETPYLNSGTANQRHFPQVNGLLDIL